MSLSDESRRIAEALAESPERVIGIATHENVTLRFPAAGPGTRYIALLIDRAVQILALVLLLLAALPFLRASEIRLADLLVFLLDNPSFLVAVYLGLSLLSMVYFLLFELFGRGRTPGKLLLGLRVISATGEAASAGQIIVRSFLRFFHSIPGGELADGLFVLFSGNAQRAGDLAAGTAVVKSRRNKAFAALLRALGPEADPAKADALAASLLTPDPDAPEIPAAAATPAGAVLDPVEFGFLETYLKSRRQLSARDAYDRRMADLLSRRSGVSLPDKMKPAQRLAFMNRVYARELALYRPAPPAAEASKGGAAP